MRRTTEKAFLEHAPHDPCYGEDISLPMLEFFVQHPAVPLSCQFAIATHQGGKKHQEDRAFVYQGEGYLLSAVFDGHYSSAVAEFLRLQFANRFGGPYETPDAVREAFMRTIDELQQEIFRIDAWEGAGSTAVISYVDLKRHIIYTATIGDSEANCYRGIGDAIKSIPLSPVRNWLSTKDRTRFIELVTRYPQLKEDQLTYPNFSSVAAYINFYENLPEWVNPKQMRLLGLNIPRTFGNRLRYFNGLGVVAKAKLSVTTLGKGDTLILSSDGVKDQLRESAVAAFVRDGSNAETLAGNIVAAAVSSSDHSDNVTVVAIQFN